MVAAAQQMLHDMARSVPQDISNMLWVWAACSCGVRLPCNGCAHCWSVHRSSLDKATSSACRWSAGVCHAAV